MDLRKTKYSPAVVQHPLTSSGIVGIKVNGELQLMDITQSQDNLRLWQDQMREVIENASTVCRV